MGVVYEVDDRERGGRVALKTLRQVQDGDAVLRFKQEFRALQDVQHPNLVSLYELGQAEGQLYFTMELIDGQNLLSFVRPNDPHVANMAISSTMTGGALDEMTLDLKTPAGPTSDTHRVVPSVTSEVGFDEQRLRIVLPQLLHGLEALHGAQKVHRDLKPSNVLVTREGRVVVLDFGVISDAGFDEVAGEGSIVGTAAYMAPEQGEGKRVGPEADLYSVGVILYQALCGRLPFSGNHKDVIADKLRLDPPAPHLFSADVPPDLEALCLALLRRDPTERPSAGAALAALGVAASAVRHETPVDQNLFVGRRAELDLMLRALDEVKHGAAVTVIIEGESGVGKSALARQLLTRVGKPAIVLAGRCYERESVPYKAIDGVVDALSRHLSSLPGERLAAVLPDNAPILASVFPVLRRVEGLAHEGEQRFVLDPQQQRQLLFSTLRQLFFNLAQAQLLVLCIDDLQWADADSRLLLEALVRPPEAPSLLLVGTTRPMTEGRSALQLPGEVRKIALQPLEAHDAAELAQQLMPRVDVALAQRIAQEAAGHPLFIDELVRQKQSQSEAGPVRLEDALWQRINRLPPEARALLEMVAIAGMPVRYEVASLAAVADLPEIGRRVRLLVIERLIRSSGLDKEDVLEPYHDRVRESLQSKLPAAEQQSWHARLAVALEQSGHYEFEALGVHWQNAGEPTRAFDYFVRAAEEADRALAFDRAARLYRLALEVRQIDVDTAEGARLSEALGTALGNAGRGADAARALIAAAESKATKPQGMLELKRRAAEQFLRAGHIDDGMATLKQVLDAVGIWLPKRPNGSLVSLLWTRAKLRLRGLGYKARTAAAVPADQLQQLDVCLSASVGLGNVDTIRGADFQARGLLLALRAGEETRIARALAMEACHVSASGGGTEKRVDKLVKASQSLARTLGDPHALALTEACEGITAFLFGRWQQGADCCRRAIEIFENQCSAVHWELSQTYLFYLWSLTYLGELRLMRTLMTRLLREAEEHGNRYAATNLRTGSLNFIFLLDGDAQLARREAATAMEQWTQEGFHHQHWDNLLAQGEVDLYCADGKTCYQRVKETWPALQRSLLLMIQLSRIEAIHLRGRAALAYACEVPAEERPRLVKEARADARRLHKERIGWAQPFAELLLAGAASVSGDLAEASRSLDRAFNGFEETGTVMYREATRVRRAQLVGDADGERAGVAWFVGQGVAEPERFVRMLVPGVLAPSKVLPEPTAP